MDVKSINSDSQGSDEPAPPGTSGFIDKKMKPRKGLIQSPLASPSSPGMLQAKKKLRAFSIQKKAVLTPITVPKPVSTGNTTVLIGKLSGVKTTPKPEPPDPDVKKPPKPPKPGAGRKILQENYTEIQKKNVAEIEDMKRKMELVELGIPLGLICPTSTSEKAMPTKAMPPIKSFLDPAKVDELIREAKKARAEGKNFKFELSKFLPDYDNPFQRKKDNPADTQDEKDYKEKDRFKKDRRKSDKYEFKRHIDHRKKDDKDRERDRHKDKSKDRDKKSKEEKDEKKDPRKAEKGKEKEKSEKDPKETDVNLNDYLVCDSWSLDTEDKTNSSSPKGSEKALKTASIPLPNEEFPKDIEKSKELIKMDIDIPVPSEPVKVEKLQPVIDSFKYELDSNEDEVLDIFDEETDVDKFAKTTVKKHGKSYDSPASLKTYDFDQEPTTADDENFLESVINEIKQEDMSDISQDKGLVEYDMSPIKDEDIQTPVSRESVTPELDDRMRDLRSQQSSYSDGYRSSESGYKSRESGYKSDRSDSFRLSVEKDLDEPLAQKMSESTVESLETWSFILKICQPLLFRHDKNKCYKETHSTPKLWFTENPRRCSCVKDRAVVYEELETCKMPLVDRVYSCDQIAEEPAATAQAWYPWHAACFVPRGAPLSDWEHDEPSEPGARGGATPRSEEIYLDREYQRFMQAVWPEVSESKADTSRSTTPVKEVRKKKKADDGDDKKKAKKMKLSSEGWSQESEPEEAPEKSKKPKEKERRKRKHAATLAAAPDSDDARKRRKALKRKLSKKTKAKDAKRRRLSKKYLRKLKEKSKKKKHVKTEKSDDESEEKEKKKEKKAKKKKQLKQKKTQKKKKARTKSTSSSSSSSESSSESSTDEKRKKKVEKRKKKKEKRRKQSTDSAQSEELFDVNILNNIKTERLTDDEKRMEFSPRRHGEKPREIINVKELQNDFVGNNIHIKQERVEEEKEITPELELPTEKPMDHSATEFKEPEPQPPQQVPVPQTTPQPEPIPPPELPQVEETSQCSSQESIASKDHYEKDDSHLRPSSQNSNYSFNDVMASHGYKGDENRYEEGDQMRFEKGDQMRFEKGDQMRFEKGDQIRFENGDQIRFEKGDQIRYEKGVQIRFEKEDQIRFEKGDQIRYEKGDQIRFEKGDQMRFEKGDPIRYEKGDQLRYEKMDPIRYEKGDQIRYPKGDETDQYQKGDVMGQYQKGDEMGPYEKGDEMLGASGYQKEEEEYEPANYEMYEQMAMAYQSDVASQQNSLSMDFSEDVCFDSQRIETVVGGRPRGEIKCDWRKGDRPPDHHQPAHRPSRWGLKPGEVNIVLTGGGEQYQPFRGSAVVEVTHSVELVRSGEHGEQVYKIESIANRSADTNTSMSYDEAYMDMYGASDRLQYGDCFSDAAPAPLAPSAPRTPSAPSKAHTTPVPRTSDPRRASTLDARIDLALKNTVLGEVAKDPNEEDKDAPEKGILVSKASSQRAGKRVSFADGYTPGQDSDVEAPPKKKKKVRRYGCAWPCPAEHPDHVPLWDALPPPPPPASPPPPPAAAPPPALLAALRRPPAGMPPALLSDPMLQQHLAHHQQKFDPNSPMPPFMPPEPPPVMINFHLNN